MPIKITSLHNERVQHALRLRERRQRDRDGLFLIEGYRELRRALEGGWRPRTLFYCRDVFLGANEDAVIEQCRMAGADLLDCSVAVFQKLSYRDRPDGLLAVAPQQRRGLSDLRLPSQPLLLVMEQVEKPGNLGTMLRSADAGGVHAVIVCDPRTDIFNPNAVRASVGALFLLPVVEARSTEAIAWLHKHDIRILATTPAGDKPHYGCDMTNGLAIVVGAEQYGLSEDWLRQADERVVIPMHGRCDSLNVSAAATILIFEAMRQRQQATA